MNHATAPHLDEALLLRSDAHGITTLTLNRPKARNSLSAALMAELQRTLDAIAADPEARVVVLAGNGPGFCAGHDLKELRAADFEDGFVKALFAQCSQLMQRIVTLPVPVIAKVHGIATAAGCQLVASCDLAVAAEAARFATPGVNIGLFCSTPMVALSRKVGRKAAMEMLLTGDLFSASWAAERGLVNRVVADGELDAATHALARQIADRSKATVRIGKEAFYRQLEMPLAAAYDYTSEVMADNMAFRDAREGITAFLDKRQPYWSDR
ncbi:MAG: enoyl-CoA hydratase [Candidatus Competibacterales bacterium]